MLQIIRPKDIVSIRTQAFTLDNILLIYRIILAYLEKTEERY
jgi:hypothetical protein